MQPRDRELGGSGKSCIRLTRLYGTKVGERDTPPISQHVSVIRTSFLPRVRDELDKYSLSTHPKLLQCAEARHGPIVEFLFDQGEVWEAPCQGEDCLLSFDTRQMRSQAQMFVATK
jgi:hypothetical protein